MAISRSAGSTAFTFLPPIDTVPSVMVSRPAIILSSVDLPQPEGPSSTVKEPSGMASDTPFTASTPPA